ncbi:DUF3721 domain-containing protein [Synechococcus sp. CCY 9618]|nr:DUF3721 domain-containing protein [Synechococcus sp. CCY 9618]
MADPLPDAVLAAVFATTAEAEAAAKHFNCKGAHRMGDQWMPCREHPGP